MKLVVETGKLSSDDLAMMLIRKHDFHDYDGAKWLLEHGADPNGERRRGWYPLHHALRRSNGFEMFRLLLDYHANPMVVSDGLTAVARAAREGRNDVLALFAERGIDVTLHGVDRLIAACARDDAATVRAITAQEPALAAAVVAMGGTLTAKFASNWNLEGVRHLLDLGVPADAPFPEGDGYFDITKGSLAIHVATWRAQPAIVKLLIARGSPADVPDAKGRTPLMLAVKACVDSYWTDRRSPDSVKALLDAGASVEGVPYPCGYDAVDELLAAKR
jgi:ankyrin repeat protein